MSDKYILAEDGKTAIPCDDLMTWAIAFESSKRIIAQDEVGGVRVSTVFLGLDHNYGGKGLPVLWETMIFGGEHDNYQERYTSYDDALEGHRKALSMVSLQVVKH